MNIKEITPADVFPSFLCSSLKLLDILVKDVLAVWHSETPKEGETCWSTCASLQMHTSCTFPGDISLQRTFKQTG